MPFLKIKNLNFFATKQEFQEDWTCFHILFHCFLRSVFINKLWWWWWRCDDGYNDNDDGDNDDSDGNVDDDDGNSSE